ncbi:hypothetical protein JL720_12422 [Aureococcus anophagefferens]|nr:hypothetical protein JL720_12422 [Aureococcus anophagefferens]
MRAVNLLCVAAVASAAVSWEEAKCVMEGKSIAFMGDSISRNCFYVFNKFLDTGEIEWTDWERFSFVKESHRCYFKKEFDDIDATSEFWFLQKAWSDRATRTASNPSRTSPGGAAKADIAVINSGWWDLKEDDDADRYCGDDFGKDDCEKDYKASLEKLDDGEKWIDAIEDANDAAKEVMGAAGVGVVEIYDNYDSKDIDDHTTDGKHPDPDACRRWFDEILPMIDAKQGSGCFGATTTTAATSAPNCPALTKKACKKKKKKAYCKWKSKACQTKSCASFSTKKKCKKNASCRWRKKAEKCKSKA